MLVKFESKSNRVKGLAFHPKRPWILASLHNGVIQLWDYRMEVLIDKFEEHDGPVRGVNFHISQPLFVSGGDDYKIKVWNYQMKRCLFNLLGHLDYIRTVQFHPEYPWILSASDDQTIRIWNWQSRTCLSVLTGHNHYVMCAQFHPKEDLVLSASLDQTVRVWDVSGLRKKTVSIAGDFSNAANNADLFGGSDVVVRHVLEGHTRGVNWASFHRTLSLIVSGADDREVKLWRMNESKAWEVDTMRGHVNNVSCVLFHPKKELIISNSEDKTIRIWDMSSQKAPPKVFRRETDRYWILDAHPTLNLLAAGHDNGLVVFKVNRERPPFDSNGSDLYYFKDSYVYEYNVKSGKEHPILSTRRNRGNANVAPRTLDYNFANRAQHNLLLFTAEDNSYELYCFPKGESTRDDAGQSAQRGIARCAVFVSRNRFALLDTSRQIWLKNLKNEIKRKISIPDLAVTHIFPGGIGRILLRTADAMILYDVQSLKTLATLNIQSRHPIKYVSWSRDSKYVAMFSKANIYIANSKLEEQCALTENSRVKSGAWDACGVFVYTTGTHLKYVLPNGDSGIIKTLDNTVYLTSVSGNALCFLDREVKIGTLPVDATEYQFKVALMKRRNHEVLRIMRSKKLVGQSIIAYLQRKGYPEVALHFVQDDNTKFSLALECGNIQVARECAIKLDTNECWNKLGVEALRQGNHQVVEVAYQKTKNFDGLSFLYLITGNVEKLNKMLQISGIRGDSMARFHNALYLGNVPERVTVLRESGQLPLALLTAQTHGLTEEAAAIQAELGDECPELPDTSQARVMLPPMPILKDSNWPLIAVGGGFFDNMGDKDPEEPPEEQPEDERPEKGDAKKKGGGKKGAAGDVDIPGWGADGDLPDVDDDEKKETQKGSGAGGGGGGWGADALLPDLDIDIPIEDDGKDAKGSNVDPSFVMPLAGKSAMQKWAESSSLAPDMIAAGNFDLAMHLLNRQLGIVNFVPLKPAFLSIYNYTHVLLPTLPGLDPLRSPLTRGGKEEKSNGPLLCYTLANCIETLKLGYKAVSEGAFQKAMESFLKILRMIPLIVVDKKAAVQEVIELVAICKEYITAMRLELQRKDVEDPVRQAALSAYFTQCKVQLPHLILGLRVAIKCNYSIQNFKTAGNFCRRVLEMVSTSSNAASLENIANPKQVRSVLTACEKTNTDAKQIEFSETSSLALCAETFTPIPRSQTAVRCPYCGSSYKPEFADTLCRTCQLSQIGAQGTGLRCFPGDD